MPEQFPCPRLKAHIELTDERREHILATHVDGPEVLERLRETFDTPDVVMKAGPTDEFLLAKAFDFPGRARHIVGIVVRDESRADAGPRMWVVTAFRARRLPKEGHRWQIV
ncbi:MAG: hypothetical protein C0506_06880 [Anaerolinea sp.]|nr:hypothetical protein [Anaerolinea sp.]